MAGITDIGNFSAGTPLSVVGSSAGSSILGAAAAANPYVGIASAVLGAFGGGSTKISSAKNENVSGQGAFNPKNKVAADAPMLDLGNPVQVVMLGAGLVAAIYAYHKFKR